MGVEAEVKVNSRVHRQKRCGEKPYLMVYRWFGQRWDCEGEEPAVAVFVHDLLQKQNEGGRDRKAVSLKEWTSDFNSLVYDAHRY